MSKPMLVLLIAFIAAAFSVVWKFGVLTLDQVVMFANSIVGWTLWTALVAFGYSCLERLFPNVLRRAATDNASTPAPVPYEGKSHI